MTDYPIQMSAPMVLALLENRKTQTRRILNPRNTRFVGGDVKGKGFRPSKELIAAAQVEASRPKPLGDGYFKWTAKAFDYQTGDRTNWIASITPKPGDRLYVQERVIWNGEACNFYYAADRHACGRRAFREWNKWDRASFFMNRWASRITLVVTDSKLEPVQAINGADALAEGMPKRSKKVRQFWLVGADEEKRQQVYSQAATWEFRDVWESLHKKEGTLWDDNPLVAASTFTVHQCNIDSMEAAA